MTLTAADLAKALQALEYVSKLDMKNVPGLAYDDLVDARINIKLILKYMTVEVRNA